ncbi:Eco57I restriction-modification methylase domain-containing protein [Flavobacterium sp.]|uniref:Eco57I restriction-modification methylase domain-containing protein n=1 Tax=Flavobacterium sp. TaxID=239 RepID=UPI0039197B75
MSEINKIDVEILNEIIFGRVEPHIYAFTTETTPNYLKVGDTYRPIEIRLNEWRKYFPNLEKKFETIAKVDDETFFRDHAIHYFLEKEKSKVRLQRETFIDIPYYSNEFFNETTKSDVEDAIKDIGTSYINNDLKYQFYKFDTSRIPITQTYTRTQDYEPRPNQQETIDSFKEALNKGRKNLLMYAVMRFGKSFTTMCCAVEMKAKFVMVVSAKADVKEEWKKTVESHLKFDGYIFLDSNSLLQSDTIINEKIEANEKIVIFLTLQDLQGDAIKTKHKEIFENKIDLLIIDETHFGARAQEYGKVLKEVRLTSSEIKSEIKLNDDSLDELDTTTKFINSKVRLHLSGTPYRILMDSEFTDDDIIAFYQFSDIADDQAKWDSDNLNKDDVKEWDNPYYGFPQMIRFAFNPNESSRKKMEEMKKYGVTYAFSTLFKSKSISKDKVNDNHKKFLHEQEIIDLLKVIDGSQDDENLLSFLDYDKIKEGNMCRHIVCVLPFRASCDALEELIKKNKFKILNSYEIINISGVDSDKIYKDTQSVKRKIKSCEADNIKTITLTVNRMLTGSTVSQWDTMLYFKDTASPQEYDQAIFRLQNQYIKVYKEPSGDVVKYNMKPQTLLVDFNPNRMFQMQEHKSQIYNVNTESNGNDKLEQRIKRELEISPIVVLNNNKIVQVQPADILDAIRKYSSERSVFDEATTIAVDYSLLNIDDIRLEIEKQGKINSKQGLEIKPTKGDGDYIDPGDEPTEDGDPVDNVPKSSNSEEEVDYKGQFAMYYARILFFAFLTDSRVKSLQELINQIDNNAEEQRIASNLKLNKSVLILLEKHINPFILSELDYKVHNINTLANDALLPPMERASNAMKKFSRLSDSEIVTPEIVTEKIINSLPENALTSSTLQLDIAAKQGEFVYAVYKKFGKEAASNFYSIPTSKIAYEFTRKVYKLLELDLNHIEENYTSYDLIAKNKLIKKQSILINNENMKFDIVVGNPPYHQKDGGAQASAKPIYNHFVDIAKKLNPSYISMIMPTRWFAGGKGLDNFRDEMLNDIHISELHDFLKPELIFQNINLRGGICYFLWDKNHDNSEDLTTVFTYNNDLTPEANIRSLKTEDSEIFIRHWKSLSIINKIKNSNQFESFENHVSSRRPFGLDGNITKNIKIFRLVKNGLKNPIICYGKSKKIGYLDKEEITVNKEWIDKYKVFTSYANNIGTELNDDNFNSFIGQPGTISTETYIVIGANLELDDNSALNLTKYFTSKFARFMHSLSKASHHGTSKTYKFVPLQNFTANSDIDWTKSIQEIDSQLYTKYGLTDEEKEFIESMIKTM